MARSGRSTSDGPTMAAVARACGVARSTVSKALGQRQSSSEIPQATIERIVAAARQLGYEPDWHKRLHARKRFGNIGYVYERMPSMLGVYELFPYAAAEQLGAAGFRFVPIAIGSDPISWRTAIAEYRLDGALTLGMPPPGFPAYARERGLPLVEINPAVAPAAGDDRTLVRADDSAGALALGRHLHGLGHRRVAYLVRDTQDSRHHASYDARAHGLRAAGLELVEHFGPPDALVAQVLASRPTTAVCYGHTFALQLVHELGVRGIAMPAEISVATFVNHFTTAWTLPALTTVDVPMGEMTRLACTLLLELIGGGTPTQLQHVCGEQLVVRASTGPVR